MRPRFSVILLSVVAIFIASSIPGSIPARAEPSAQAAATSVQIRDFAFSPATIVIAPGAAVTWTNADDEPHTIMANDRAYRSPPLDTGQHFTRTFATPGEYRYFCSLHPHMTGVVLVRPPAAAPRN